MGGLPREPWSVEAFKRHYDDRQLRFGGWVFDASLADVEELKREYALGIWGSLKEYAESRFDLEQLHG